MPLSSADQGHLDDLKTGLQGLAPAALEELAAGLIGDRIGVPVAVARSGFQFGADGGPAGRQGRRLRIESKRYADNTALNERELLGEIDHALARDPALEAWVLVTTREVPEQVEQALLSKGDQIGVPIVILDWKTGGFPELAALCVSNPAIVETLGSAAVAATARALATTGADAVATLDRTLAAWDLGYAAVRSLSSQRLTGIWGDRREARARLGQDAAGGVRTERIRRRRSFDALGVWWTDEAGSDAPAAVSGYDGVGKTWAVMDWLVDRREDLPITLVAPSSAATDIRLPSEVGLKQFLAGQLYELSGRRDRAHWLRRLDRLLLRPRDEGPVIALFLDGLNQEPSAPWVQILQVLQAGVFEGRVRIIVSTRNHHLAERLGELRGLVVRATPIPVEIYDEDELAQMLAFHELTPASLHPDLIPLARTPRLFDLVVQFRERLVEAGQVTVHRLLWEYGRDTLGRRAGQSFSEADWNTWLQTIAARYLEGVRTFSLGDLSATTARADLGPTEVFQRLSDIIDGRFAVPVSPGRLELTASLVAHALAAALLEDLRGVSQAGFDTLSVRLSDWLDPISGLDQRAEILRASVSILVERGEADAPACGALVAAWLQTQNLPDTHRRELGALASALTDPLLDAIEASATSAQASARHWAALALRGVPRSDAACLARIAARAMLWIRQVPLGLDGFARRGEDHDRYRLDRIVRRLGADTPGDRVVAGVAIELVETDARELRPMVPTLLDGFPLASLIDLFELAAVSSAITGHHAGWDGLKWICLLNGLDAADTAEGLRLRSAQIQIRPAGVNVHPDLPGRIASLLLWLTGYESDDETANRIDPGLDRVVDYETDYLTQPSRSLFALERRHAEAALLDPEMPLFRRVERASAFWFDPEFVPPETFIHQLRQEVQGLDPASLNRFGSYTSEDHEFDRIGPALARCAPDLLRAFARGKAESLATTAPESRYWKAIHATDALIALADDDVAEPARILRQSGRSERNGEEGYASAQLLILELKDQDAVAQTEALVRSDLPFFSTDLNEILKPPTPTETDAFVSRWGASVLEARNLLILLSIHPESLGEAAWAWVEDFTRAGEPRDRAVAFHTLSRSNPERFGRLLAARGWGWTPGEEMWISHYGSQALAAATGQAPFDQIAARIAPWLLLATARRRGSDPAEIRLAMEIVSVAVLGPTLVAPDPGADLSVDVSRPDGAPYRIEVSARDDEDDALGPMERLQAAMDVDASMAAHRRAADTAMARIDEARAQGARLYLMKLEAEDFDSVIETAPDMMDPLLEGMADLSDAFSRRVRLAEGVYLAICEALLRRNPVMGAALWHALKATLSTRFTGVADIDQMTHMVFKAPESEPVLALRQSLLVLEVCNTDAGLLDLCLAADCHSQGVWLDAKIAEDLASTAPWRHRRAARLSGYRVTPSDAPIAPWGEGESPSSIEALRRDGQQLSNRDVFARHWWRTYLAAPDPGAAYAAWTLFLRASDRRAHVWMRHDAEAAAGSPFNVLKFSHLELNFSALERAMTKNTERADGTFLGRKTSTFVSPWFTRGR